MYNTTRRNENEVSLFDAFNGLFEGAFSKEMKTDISENENNYSLNVEVPGVSKENIEVNYQDQTLTVHVKANSDNKDENKSYVRRERFSMDMERSFYLENGNEDDIKASLNDGILSITVGKVKPVEPEKKRIMIE